MQAQERQRAATSRSVQAPTRGWNAVDPISKMPDRFALALENFWPTPTEVRTRKGYTSFATLPTDDINGTRHDIRGLLSYQAPDGTIEAFACDQTGIYEITAGGSISSVASASTDGRWNSVNISNSGGAFLWCCNGVDKSRYYNGSAWTILDGGSTPSLTGVTSTDITQVALFKSRLFFIIKNTLDFAFLAVNSVAGAASVFPLGALMRRGGSLLLVDSWSLDAGDGIDDYMVFVSSEGEAAVYKGTDPAVAANWELVGVFFIGKPLSNRCSIKVGGDLVILTVQGAYPLSKALGKATTEETSALSYSIQNAFVDATAAGRSLYGWQVEFFPAATMLLFNIPIKVDDTINLVYTEQYVMNTTNNAWAKFKGMSAEVWGVHNNELYFALHNRVLKAWTNATDEGVAIISYCKQAFSTLGRPNENKLVNAVRPIADFASSVEIRIGIDSDFEVASTIQLQQATDITVAKWDIAQYDTAIWSGSALSTDWDTVSNNPGRWISLVYEVTTSVDFKWFSTDYIYEIGDIL